MGSILPKSSGNLFLDAALFVLKLVLGNVTPMLKAWLQGLVKEFQTMAANTPNEWDDLLANFLADLLDVEKQ